jgi:hypothetical protein
MYKWIQRAEKPLGHSDYTNLTTQICRSNHSSPDFGQNQTKKVTKKPQKVERLDYILMFSHLVRDGRPSLSKPLEI